MSSARHVLHVERERHGGEWHAWCCCGWSSDTWRTQDAAHTCADVHAAWIASPLYRATSA